MKNFFPIKIEPLKGSQISDCIDEAVELAKFTDSTIQFEFNTILIKVTKDSIKQQVYNYYMNHLHS